MKSSILALSVACVLACDTSSAPVDPVVDAEKAPTADVLERPTTEGALALRNLSAQIEAVQGLLKKTPNRVDLVRSAVALLLTRTQFLGTYDDFRRVDELTLGALAAHPRSYEALLARADLLSAVHRFDEALDTLARAEVLGAPSQDQRRTTCWLATGTEMERVLRLRSGAASRFPTFHSITDLAAAYAARGDFERADSLYVRALEIYRDVSPLPVAWVAFQRGVMWAEMAGKRAWAKPLYEEAVRRLPGFVVANVHLAEIEFEEGEQRQALDRLRRLVHVTPEPEAFGRLAAWSDEGERAHYKSEADARYDRLLGTYEAAFRDHAAEFYLGAGAAPALALELALENLVARDVPRAHLIALQASSAVGDKKRTCDVAQRARRFAWNVNLQEAVEQLATECP